MQGDYYSVKSESRLPPVFDEWSLAKDGEEPAPDLEKVKIGPSKGPQTALRCSLGHGLKSAARKHSSCDVCGATGTAFRCAGGCDWDACQDCWAKQRTKYKAEVVVAAGEGGREREQEEGGEEEEDSDFEVEGEGEGEGEEA